MGCSNCDNLVYLAWEGNDGESVLFPFVSPALPRVDDILSILNIDDNTQTRYVVADVEFNATISNIEEEIDLDNIIICLVPIEDRLPYSLEELEDEELNNVRLDNEELDD